MQTVARSVLASFLRRGWSIIVGLAVVGGLAGFGIASLQENVYRATATLMVVAGPPADPNAVQDPGAGRRLASTYARVGESTTVLQAALTTLAPTDLSVEDLRRRIELNPLRDTQLIELAAEDTTGARAAAIANAVATALADYSSRLQQLSGGAGLGRLTVAASARPPGQPARPSVPLDSGLGVVAGLVVGLWVAFVRFSRDDRIRTPEDIEEMDVTLLGTIARTPRRESGRVTWPAFFSAGLDDRKGNSPWEILDNLRRALRAGAPAVLVVTSPGRGEGKSVFAANLGLALARSGRRVILVDGHLRRPVLKAMFSIPAGAWATGRPSPPKPRAVIRGLSVVSAAPPGTPAGLLHSRAAGQAIERWRHRADFVIIDAGPLLNAPDGIIWLPHADGALLVLRAGASRLGQLDDALELLERATTPVVGAVLNDVRPGRRQRG